MSERNKNWPPDPWARIQLKKIKKIKNYSGEACFIARTCGQHQMSMGILLKKRYGRGELCGEKIGKEAFMC